MSDHSPRAPNPRPVRPQLRLDELVEGARRGFAHLASLGVLLVRDIAATAQKELEDHGELHDKWAREALGPLLDELGWGAHHQLVAALESGDDEAVDDLLQRALTGVAFQTELRSLIEGAEISAPNQEQLVDGLELLVRGHFASAGGLLILGVEGVIWGEAVRRQIIVRATKSTRMVWLQPDGTREVPVASVEKLFEPLDAGPATTEFLRRHVYGGSGNPYRHGNAPDGWKRRSLMLVVSLVIVLKRMHGIAEPLVPGPVFGDDISNLLLRAFRAVEPEPSDTVSPPGHDPFPPLDAK